MSRRRHHLTPNVLAFIGVALLGFLIGGAPAWAQAFSSGSTGADGALAPTANTTLPLPPDGVFNFTTVNVPAGVTVTFAKNAANTPVTLLATGDVVITGLLSVNGGNGANPLTSGPLFTQGAAGGPGGFPGGTGGARGGGQGAGAGHGPGGGAPGTLPSNWGGPGAYGAQSSFVSLLPLFGGSGGGGGQGTSSISGGSGGGGGGALVIASSTEIRVTGTIRADGGFGGGGVSPFGCDGTVAGGGSGGAIRLVAPLITGAGTLSATGVVRPDNICGVNIQGAPGRIRLEAFTVSFTGTISPAASISNAPGPITAASNPALSNLPTLTITSVGGTAVPGVPSGSYSVADVSLPQGTTNPVTVLVTSANIPLPTNFTVKLLPQFGAATSIIGTFTSATASVSVNFPTGQVSVLNAFASFTLPQLASLGPMFDGEPIERVMVATEYGSSSTLTLVTKSGKEVRPDQLPQADQLKLAMAFEALSTEPRK